MGAFTRLGAAELADVAAAFDLGAFRGSESIAAGTINSNFAIETDRGRWFVRVNEGKSEVDVAWEARLISALAAGGVITPPPVPARDGRPYAPLGFGVASGSGETKWVSAFPWRMGHHLGAAEVTPRLVGALGASLAQLHLVGLALPEAWRRTSIYDHEHLVARYQQFAGNQDPALAHAIRILGEDLAILGEATSRRREATIGIIHGDLFRDNVLWDRDAVVALLDFEQASGGSLAYDLAVCINDWCWNGAPDLGLARAVVEGYQGTRALSPGDREALPIEVRAAATRFTITRITDVYLAGVVNGEKDFRAFLARCEAWRGPALGQLASLL